MYCILTIISHISTPTPLRLFVGNLYDFPLFIPSVKLNLLISPNKSQMDSKSLISNTILPGCLTAIVFSGWLVTGTLLPVLPEFSPAMNNRHIYCQQFPFHLICCSIFGWFLLGPRKKYCLPFILGLSGSARR